MTVSARGISKTYSAGGRSSRTITAVELLDIDIEPGKLTVILGRSGSGKTTLVNILAGLLSPSSGNVLYDGKDIYADKVEELSAFRSEHIGYIPQGQSTLSALTVRENILMPAAAAGKDGAQADSLMELFGLTHLRDAYPSELSGGELRRTVIARALVNSQEVIFADEPTNDLDDENTQLVFTELKRYSADGRAVVIVTHERSAESFADTIYRMEQGKLTRVK